MGQLLKSFGVAAAYLVPGTLFMSFPFLFQSTVVAAEVTGILGNGSQASWAVLTAGAVTCGLIANAARALIFERVLFLFLRIKFDFNRLSDRDGRETMDYLTDNFYRHHQFFGNMSLAIGAYYAAYCIYVSGFKFDPLFFVVVFVEVLLLFAAFDALRNYYNSLRQLFPAKKEL